VRFKANSTTNLSRTPSRDEQLFMIAQSGEWKVVRRGSFSGLSTFAGNEYLSAKLEGQDGFSGSPVYDREGELVEYFAFMTRGRVSRCSARVRSATVPCGL